MTATAPPPLVGAGVRLLAVVVAILVVAGGGGRCHGALLKAHFYRHSCPAAEAVVRDIVLARVAADPAKLPAKLLRLFFHDCFVRVRTYGTCMRVHDGIITDVPWYGTRTYIGVRRVGADRLDAGQHGGEGRCAERVAGRLRRDRHREGRAGGRVPRHRLLRRHRGARRQGRRLVPGTCVEQKES
jgi:hypothetical protein